jgi:AmmeMemoRadiSam system protein B/AmmeMemoRadiSam system protein A
MSARMLAVVAAGFGWLASAGAAPAATPDPSAAPKGRIREPAVAGSFYPGEAGPLRAAVRRFLRDAVPPAGPRPIALVAPHAGYVYSGQVAADAWRQAEGQPVDLVVILGANHTAAGFRRVALYPGDGFRTPLGIAAIDREAARALAQADPDVVLDAVPHAAEHSVEVQIPFAQVLFPAARIVPLVIGAPDPALCDRLGAALGAVLRGRRALVVASSDLAHYPSARDAEAVDARVLGAVVAMDAAAVRRAVTAEMARGVPGLATCACGEGPILAAIAAARALGATRATLVRQATSADVPGGEPGRVVGYGAVVFDAGELDAAARAALLSRAREAIAGYLARGESPAPRPLPPAAALRRGAFVTLTRADQLRGCIGRLSPDEPLGETVAAVAIEAAVHDARFPPVTRAELDRIEIEISVLTPSRPVAAAAEVVVGRDGVLLSKGGRRAVFLPQVADEQGWGREELLDHLCEKARLPAGCWREGASLSVFQAEVFGEAHRP